MNLLEILALLIMAIGFAMVYASKTIVSKYGLAKKQTCEHADQMSEEEVEEYKYNKAVVNFKMMGLVVTIPGIVLFILSSR